ncbi:MAG: DNA alkylation repair protein, partial [Gemmatimonadales bacterium]
AKVREVLAWLKAKGSKRNRDGMARYGIVAPWSKARQWSRSPREFVKRGGFALMASLAGHDRSAPDASFRAFLPAIARGAGDDRNFVKKGVSWALRRIGGRSPALNRAALALARKLAASPHAAARWVGRDALRDLKSPATRARLARSRRSGR